MAFNDECIKLNVPISLVIMYVTFMGINTRLYNLMFLETKLMYYHDIHIVNEEINTKVTMASRMRIL